MLVTINMYMLMGYAIALTLYSYCLKSSTVKHGCYIV